MKKEIIVIYSPVDDVEIDQKTRDLLKDDGYIVLVVSDPSIKEWRVDVHYRGREKTQVLTKFNPNIFSCAEERPTK